MNRNPVKNGDKLAVYVDGTSRGNPGPAARAFIFFIMIQLSTMNAILLELRQTILPSIKP